MMSSFKRKQSSYDALFKLCIIEFAENYKNPAAERQYDVLEVGLLLAVTLCVAGTRLISQWHHDIAYHSGGVGCTLLLAC